ncbi:NXPE family member 3-like [Branchiostoma floridae x Branchiostoma belcheri]
MVTTTRFWFASCFIIIFLNVLKVLYEMTNGGVIEEKGKFKIAAPRLKNLHGVNNVPAKNHDCFDMERVTSANYTKVSIVKSTSYNIGDTLTIKMVAMDKCNQHKTSGGDFFIAKLYATHPCNASTAGKVIDFGNGTYNIHFVLQWSGTLSLSVTLIHPSEAVNVLRRIRDKSPSRRVMSCDFVDKNTHFSERTDCSHTPRNPYPGDICDFSKPSVNATWYCGRPRRLSCDSLQKCQRNPRATSKLHTTMLTPDEKQLFTRILTNQEVPNIIKITVTDTSNSTILPQCGPNLQDKESEGYWYNGTWNSNLCDSRTFSESEVYECFESKTIYLQGDSTLKQWYQFLTGLINGTDIRLKNTTSEGPHMAVNYAKNIKLHFRFHHLPINRPYLFQAGRLHYVADEIDRIPGGRDTVIVLGLWAHFAAESMDVFRSRLYGIRHAIIRLHQRSPETKVIWRTSNTREHINIHHFLENSDWFSYQLLQETKLILGDLKIVILDVWDMSVSQWQKHLCHPPNDVVKNHIDLLLSFLC